MEWIAEAAILNGHCPNGAVGQLASLSVESISDLRNRYPDGHPLGALLLNYQSRLDLARLADKKFLPLLHEILATFFPRHYADEAFKQRAKVAVRRAVKFAISVHNAREQGESVIWNSWQRVSTKGEFDHLLAKGTLPSLKLAAKEVKATKKAPAFRKAADSFTRNL
ncbi:hypothetical protein [Luteolibacter sp. LG18]|uniref:hypothetical protein n=1 Tax=Luteolibacter sp. LG18 TaxID=2819286 RepID=UPI0030C769A4